MYGHPSKKQLRTAATCLAAGVLVACAAQPTRSERPAQQRLDGASSNAPSATQRVDNSVEKRLPSEALLTDLLAHEACGRMRGSFFPLLMKSEASDERAVSGRLWIQGCESGKHGSLAQVSFQGSGWRWVSRAKERLGAEFKVSE